MSDRRAEDRSRFAAIFIAAFTFLLWVGAYAAPAAASQCSDLAQTLSLTFDNGAALAGPATVQDITSGSYTPAGSTTPITGLPPFCRVALDISSTGNPAESQILVEVWLPESGWNGRYLGTGNGGFAGTISTTALEGRPAGGLCGRQHRHGHRRAVQVQLPVLWWPHRAWRAAGRIVRASGFDQGFRLSRDASDDRCGQAGGRGLLRAARASRLFRRLLDRRAAVADGGATLPGRLQRHPRRRTCIRPDPSAHVRVLALRLDACINIQPADHTGVVVDQRSRSGEMRRS